MREREKEEREQAVPGLPTIFDKSEGGRVAGLFDRLGVWETGRPCDLDDLDATGDRGL